MTGAKEKVLILDFGSQYTQLIARRVREARVFCQVVHHSTGVDELSDPSVKAIILSGGPASVTAKDSPECSADIFGLGKPVLGICYGLQIMGKLLGGRVASSAQREYGQATLRLKDDGSLFKGMASEMQVWMSHGDKLESLPDGFSSIGETDSSSCAAISDPTRDLYAVQFHP